MTAFLELSNQPITAKELQELLSVEGLSYECIGAGVRESLECLTESRRFYDLPEVLEQPLEQFADHLKGAFVLLQGMREMLQSDADRPQSDD